MLGRNVNSKKKKKAFPFPSMMTQWQLKLQKGFKKIKSRCARPFWHYCWKKVKNNPDKPLIFVTLAELKWKACLEEIFFFFKSILCLVKSRGPKGVGALAWHTLGAGICSTLAGCWAEFKSISVCCGAFRCDSSSAGCQLYL